MTYTNTSRKKLRLETILVIGMTACAMTACAQSTEDEIQQLRSKIDELDQRLRVSDRKKEISDEEAVERAKSGASVATDTGFIIRSNDGNYSIRFGADLQTDNRSFIGGSNAN